MLARKRSPKGNAFNSTLQGQSPGESAEWTPLCIYGKKYRYSNCPYIIPEVRPAG